MNRWGIGMAAVLAVCLGSSSFAWDQVNTSIYGLKARKVEVEGSLEGDNAKFSGIVTTATLRVSGTATCGVLYASSVISGLEAAAGSTFLGITVNEDVDINLDAADEEVAIDQATNAYAAGGSVLKIHAAEDADGDNQQYLIRASYKNDGGANNEFLIFQDNSSGAAGNGDAKFTVAEEGNTTIAGTLSVDGATDLDDLDVDLSAELNIDGELVCIGATGDGGTADGDDDLIVKGDLEVDDTLDVDGDIDLDGDGFDVDITGGFSVDGDSGSNLGTSSGDITVEAETGSVTIKGDEGAADAISLDADETALGGVTIAANTGGVDVNLTADGPFAIDGDLVSIGNAGADGNVADGDDDLLVVGVLEVDGELELDGTLDADSTSDFADTATFSKGSGNAIVVSAGGAMTVDTINETGTGGVTIEAANIDEGVITHAGLRSTVNTGFVSAATVSAVEKGDGARKQVVLTCNDVEFVIDGTAGDGWGTVELYTFPEGIISFECVVVENLIVTPDGGDLATGEGGDFSFGTTGTSDNTLDGTDVDLCPKTSIDPIETSTDAVLAAETAHFDGHTTAITLNASFMADDDDVAGLSTNTFDATITVTYDWLGDY